MLPEEGLAAPQGALKCNYVANNVHVSPQFQGFRLLELALQIKGQDFADHKTLKTLRFVSKPIKVLVDEVAPLTKIGAIYDRWPSKRNPAHLFKDCPKLLPKVQVLNVNFPSDKKEFKLYRRINFAAYELPSLRKLQLHEPGIRGWKPAGLKEFLASLTSLESLRVHHLWSEPISRVILEFLATKKVMPTLKDLELGPPLPNRRKKHKFTLLAAAIENLSRRVKIESLCVPGDFLFKSNEIFKAGSLPYLKFLEIPRLCHSEAPSLALNFPEWPLLESVTISDYSQHGTLDFIARYPCIHRHLKSLELNLYYDDPDVVFSYEKLNHATQLEELRIWYDDVLPETTGELRLPKLKKLTLNTYDQGPDIHYEEFSLFNLKNFPELQSFKCDFYRSAASWLIDLGSPPQQPMKLLDLYFWDMWSYSDLQALASLWMPKFEEVYLNCSFSIDQLEALLEPLQKDFEETGPMWPMLRKLLLIPTRNYNCSFWVDPRNAEFFQNFASCGAHFPLLSEFVVGRLDDKEVFDVENAASVVRAIENGVWPHLEVSNFKCGVIHELT